MSGLNRVISTDRHGGKNPDTVDFDDSTILQGSLVAKVQALTLIFDDQRVGGIIIAYNVFGTIHEARHVGSDTAGHRQATIRLAHDEHVTSIVGRGGNIIDFLEIRTDRGQVLSGGGIGGSPFVHNIPAGSHVVQFNGGTNGHLHSIGVVTAPLPPAGLYAGFGGAHLSPVEGETHPDTVHFDDYSQQIRQGRIASVSIHFNQEGVHGISTTYDVAGKQFVHTHINPASLKQDLLVDTLTLGPNDYITEVTGRRGNVYDYLIIKASNGQQIQGGGFGGSPFPNLVPAGARVVAFAGGRGGHIHNLRVYYQ